MVTARGVVTVSCKICTVDMHARGRHSCTGHNRACCFCLLQGVRVNKLSLLDDLALPRAKLDLALAIPTYQPGDDLTLHWDSGSCMQAMTNLAAHNICITKGSRQPRDMLT